MTQRLQTRHLIEVCKVVNPSSYSGLFRKTDIDEILNNLNIDLVIEDYCEYFTKSSLEDKKIILNDDFTADDRQLCASFALGHYLMHEDHVSTLESIWLNDMKERNAFKFALELLTPARMIYKIATKSRHTEIQLAEVFGVSVETIQQSLQRLR